MITESFHAIKQTEARQRMAAVRRAGKNRRAARALDRRNGLADGSKGRITNLPQVMRAMARWAESD